MYTKTKLWMMVASAAAMSEDCAVISNMPQDKDNWYVFANLFLVKEGATYGELRDGTGYLCYHDSPGVPIRCRSFTSFKSKFEKYFENFVIKCEELKVFVDMDVSWERGCGA